MAEFKVDTDKLRTCADRLSSLQRELDTVAVKLGAMQLGSTLQIKASTALVGKVADCKWAAAHQSDDLGRLARGLSEAAQLYDNNEKNLTEPKTETPSEPSGNSEDKPFLDWDIAELIKWLGKKNVPLGLVAAWNDFSKGDFKGGVNGVKNLLTVLGNGTKAIFGTGGWDSKLISLMGFNPQKVGGLGDSWQKWLESMNMGKQATPVGKFATFCKWAGYALTYVTEGVDNFKEHGEDWGNSRFWGETIIEGTTSIALSVGAGILVAAALPAATPAIVVGAVSAGVVWLGNEVCESFTGQDIGEWVSDIVYGDGKAAEVMDQMNESLRMAGDKIADAWNSGCKWAGALFG